MGQFWIRNRDFIVYVLALLALLGLVYISTLPSNPIILHDTPDSIHVPGNMPNGP